MPLIAHQTTHKVEERISELSKLVEIFLSIESQTQGEKNNRVEGRREQEHLRVAGYKKILANVCN